MPLPESNSANKNTACGLVDVTTTKIKPPINLNVTEPAASCGGTKYVTKAGDTCDSIAQGNLVSSGSLYETNPELLDCTNPTSGTKLCLPPSCEKQYNIKTGDDCVSVALANSVSWQQLKEWNGMIDCSGTNMLGDNPKWGSTVCISPPGGTFDKPPTNGTNTGVGGPGATGDGYGIELVDLPAGATLASKTTTKCGQYYAIKQGDTCATIVVDHNVPSDLFIAANPSLRAARLCDGLLTVGHTYCIHPLKNFDKVTPTGSPPLPSASQKN
jgi:LysM repeat protein